ncbi:putative NADH dehydrogenase [ubiquinone] 1 alpha subcomplex subunit 5 [Morus notabilis]|uniref:Putative NADH dehydrogenase [ubiquinone] 1 alpha subcomplex subunit 5 n=1 Tax=Morus notabilis TaxID=981085 RepID=W9RSG4_9ROSA|nr:putative NADH dehydrogenase [ubiquinone] 1 alpha subcomplex subunit 5 [Morus notabilis]
MFLRAIERMLLAKVKHLTGIVGREKALKEVQAIPEDEIYRKVVEDVTRRRLKVCQEEENWEVVEKRIACGQVEELIEEARDKFLLTSKFICP